MKITLKSNLSGKLKTIIKPSGYPVEIGNQIMFRRWGNAKDTWTVLGIKDDNDLPAPMSPQGDKSEGT